jgi:hypothetical protein
VGLILSRKWQYGTNFCCLQDLSGTIPGPGRTRG